MAVPVPVCLPDLTGVTQQPLSPFCDDLKQTYEFNIDGYNQFKNNITTQMKTSGVEAVYVFPCCTNSETVRFAFLSLDTQTSLVAIDSQAEWPSSALTLQNAYYIIMRKKRRISDSVDDSIGAGADNAVYKMFKVPETEQEYVVRMANRETPVVDESQLQELFVTLSVSCLLGTANTTFVGAFVHASPTNGVHLEVASLALRGTSMHDMIDDRASIGGIVEVLHEFRVLTDCVSERRVILFDNKPKNALCFRDKPHCYPIDFDPAHTFVLKSRGIADSFVSQANDPFSKALCRVFNRTLTVVQIQRIYLLQRFQPEELKECLKEACESLAEALEAFTRNKNESFLRRARPLFKALITDTKWVSTHQDGKNSENFLDYKSRVAGTFTINSESPDHQVALVNKLQYMAAFYSSERRFFLTEPPSGWLSFFIGTLRVLRVPVAKLTNVENTLQNELIRLHEEEQALSSTSTASAEFWR